MFPELTRKPHPTHEQSRYSFSSVHNVELGNLMKEEEEEEEEDPLDMRKNAFFGFFFEIFIFTLFIGIFRFT